MVLLPMPVVPPSSGPPWMIKVRPITLNCPDSLTYLALKEFLAMPEPSVLTLPRSPTWLKGLFRSPWFTLKGLSAYGQIRSCVDIGLRACCTVTHSCSTVGASNLMYVYSAPGARAISRDVPRDLGVRIDITLFKSDGPRYARTVE